MFSQSVRGWVPLKKLLNIEKIASGALSEYVPICIFDVV
jgi:hypothetical protein